jgi:hypothetical protein
MDRVEWPVDVPAGPQAPVGVAVVSFNTMDLTAQMIYSLFRHVRAPRFHLVVVDNASTDGSAQMLKALANAGLCEAIFNSDQRYHGPGLNQAIDHLARRQAAVAAHDCVGYLWVLDSDCMVTRDDALSASTDLMRRTGAGIVGQRIYDDWHHGDMMGLHCLLLDPRQVWRASITPFQEHGSPSEALQQSAVRAGIKTANFPFTSAGYAVHLGRGTLRAIAGATAATVTSTGPAIIANRTSWSRRTLRAATAIFCGSSPPRSQTSLRHRSSRPAHTTHR